MTIPIQQPQIHPQFVQNQQTPGLEVLARALQQRQELEMQREQLRRQREQFELNKRIAGTQLEGMELENIKRKRELKDKEDDLLAQDTAHQLYSGNLTRINDAKGWGEVIAGVKDKRVGAHLMAYLQEHFETFPRQSYQFRDVPGKTQTGSEVVGFNPDNPSDVQRTGVAAQDPQEPGRRIPVVTEREKASYAVGAAQANQTINRLEATDPSIGGRVARKAAVRQGMISGIMRRIVGTSSEDASRLVEQQIEQSMTPEELQYYQAAKLFMSNTLPALSGKAITAREYMMQGPAYFSMGGVSPQVVQARRKARAGRIRGFLVEAGDAMTERQSELPDPEEYGLAPVQQSPGTTVTPRAPRYHRKFRNTGTP